jgi:zinc transport system substrate-binding protein
VRRGLVSVVLAVAIGVAGCATRGGPGATRGKLAVVAAFYPVAEAAQRVGGRRVAVQNLTPAGAEPHDLELTTKEVDSIDGARLVVVMGRDFQPAVEKAAKQRNGPTLVLLDKLIRAKGKKVEEGKAGALDPHVWLDPTLMAGIVDQVRQALVKADPAHGSELAANAGAYRAKLAQLDARYRTGLAHCARKVIVTAHEAFGYLARRYGLRQQGVAGISPDQEPDPQRLAALTDLVKRDGITVVFTEALVSPKIAQTLARESGVKTDVLNPLEGLTPREVSAGKDYISVMDDNLGRLRRALGCT